MTRILTLMLLLISFIDYSTLSESENVDSDVPCTDGLSSCLNGHTCCLLSSGQYACCLSPNAVCCGDNLHCCPNGYNCAIQERKCLKGEITILSYAYSPAKQILHKHVACNHGYLDYCLEKDTCCGSHNYTYGCCPLQNAVCCNDSLHCCPNGYECDVKDNKCIKDDISIPFYQRSATIKNKFTDFIGFILTIIFFVILINILNIKMNENDSEDIKVDTSSSNCCVNKTSEYDDQSKISETTIEKNLSTENEDVNLFIPTRDSVFVGRDDIFIALDDKNSKRIKIFYGLPGVGKTSIAKEYAYRKVDDGTIDKIYWFDADSEDKVNEMLYKYGTLNPDFKLEENRLETINRFLNSIQDSKRIIFIFDNVEDFEDVNKPLDINLLKCKIIITTKNAKIKPTYATRIEISPFGFNEMRDYIKQTILNFDIDQVNRIIEKLVIKNECLPYKLTMISTLLNNDSTTNIDELLDSPEYGKSNKFLIRILERLNEKESQAVELLKYLVVLDPDNIPRQLIEKIMKEREHKEAIKAMSNQNLCKINAANTSQYGLRVHRLLQYDLEKYFTSIGVDYDEIRNQLEKMIDNLFPVPEQHPDQAWIESGFYYLHAMKIINEKENQSKNLLLKIGLYNGIVVNNYKKAIEYIQKVLNKMNTNEISPEISYLYHYLGYFYSSLGDKTKALEYFMKSLDMRQIFYKDDHPDIATSYDSIGMQYSESGDTTKALEYYTIALDILKRLFEGNHPKIATLYNNIGGVNSKLGDTTKALEYYMLALDMRQKLFKEDHPSIATSYNNIGMVYSSLGDTAKALEYSLKALDIRQKLFKGDHPDVAGSYNNIGAQYSKLGDTSKALEYLLKALDIQQRLFAGDNPLKASLYNKIGGVYSQSDNTSKALEYLLKALEIQQRLFTGDHPDIALSYINIGYQYSKLDENKMAIEYFMKALEMQQRLFTGDHTSIAQSYNNIGMQYSTLGDTTKALEYLLKALEMQQRLFTGDNPLKASLYNNIGMQYSKLGDTSKALEYSMKTLDIQERLFTGDHPDIAISYNNIGAQYSKLNENKMAIEYFMKALEMRQRLFTGDHLDIATSYIKIGGVYSKLDDARKALEYYTIALDILKRLFEGNHPKIATLYYNIGHEYSKLGDTEKSVNNFKLSLNMFKKI